jgi:hypothetical protein
MYAATLSGIKKESTAVLNPTEWVLLINECYLNWVRDKADMAEFNQKIIEDLQPIHVIAISSPTSGNLFTYPSAVMKTLGIQFKITYVNNICGLTGVSGWLKSKPMRADNYGALSYYSNPKDNRLYYKITGNVVELITGTSSTASSMRIEYIKYPTAIALGPPDVPGEIRALQRQEIVDLAVRTYLERVKEERYQSNLQEDMFRVGKK